MTTVNVRIEEKTKKAASKALKDMGLDLSSGIKLFLNRVVTEKGLPFKPTNRSPKEIRARWDAQVAEALRSGKRYDDVGELMRDLEKGIR
jgi:DNA-damage-inducible protein J